MKFDICIVGLGYVGLTLAAAFANKGLRVLGVEKRADIVEKTNAGIPHFQENGLDEILEHVVGCGNLVARERLASDDEIDSTFIITVGTPLTKAGQINLDFIQSATRDILHHVTDGSLVVLRSTVKVGTCRDIVIPILQSSGKACHVAMCPERTLEGRAMEELGRLPQIIGADTPEAMARAEKLFTSLTNAIIKLSSYEAAEITKLVDNTYRDVQFAFANEVARICEAYSVNVMEVVEGGKLGYPRTNVASPGLVGGPCLEKDPHIFRASAQAKGLDLEMTRASRVINERQPQETVSFIRQQAKQRGVAEQPTISVLGLAFKGVPETDDLRGAMSLTVLRELEQQFPDARYRIFDPVIERSVLEDGFPGYEVCDSIRDAVAQAHIAIITNNHPRMAKWTPNQLSAWMAPSGFVYDYWNNFSSNMTDSLSENYYAVGNV
ncbi:nucleotide sugar dehydrogenase [Kordiimonas sp.]|uniref:nucleotide sugar dehydrogenase n=1 Tax=Kordiimonas sp. TaxID=1970157 RepID=UPI003A8FDCF5